MLERRTHQGVRKGGCILSHAVQMQIDVANRVHELKEIVARLAVDIQNKRGRIFVLEKQIYRDEHDMKQSIVDLRTGLRMKAVEMKQIAGGYTAEFTALNNHTEMLRYEIIGRGEEIENLRRRIIELSKFDLSARDYCIAVSGEVTANRQIISLRKSNTSLQMEAVWLEHEKEKVEAQTAVIMSRMTVYDARVTESRKALTFAAERAESMKVERDVLANETERALVVQMERMREKEKRAVSKIEGLRGEHVSIVSRTNALSSALTRVRIQLQRVTHDIQELGEPVECDLTAKLETDERERYEATRTKYMNNVRKIDSEAKNDFDVALDKISEAKQARQATNGRIADERGVADALDSEARQIERILCKMEQESATLDEEYKTMNQVMETQTTHIFSVIGSLTRDEPESKCGFPQVVSLEQVKREHDIEAKIIKTRQVVQQLRMAVDEQRAINNDRSEQQRRADARMATAQHKHKQVEYFVHRRSIEPETSFMTERLHSLQRSLAAKIRSKKTRIAEKRESIARKRDISTSVHSGIAAMSPAVFSPEDPGILTMQTLWKTIETEIFIWRGIQSDKSMLHYLKKWDAEMW